MALGVTKAIPWAILAWVSWFAWVDFRRNLTFNGRRQQKLAVAREDYWTAVGMLAAAVAVVVTGAFSALFVPPQRPDGQPSVHLYLIVAFLFADNVAGAAVAVFKLWSHWNFPRRSGGNG